MADLHGIRESLATALGAAGRVVYSFPKEQIAMPAIVIVPGSPYIEPDQAVGDRVRVNLAITACVNVADNQAALVNLEALMLSVISLMPVNINMSSWASPKITQVGAVDALTSEMQVEVYY